MAVKNTLAKISFTSYERTMHYVGICEQLDILRCSDISVLLFRNYMLSITSKFGDMGE